MGQVSSPTEVVASTHARTKTLLKLIRKSGKNIQFLLLQAPLEFEVVSPAPAGIKSEGVVLRVFLRGAMNLNKAKAAYGEVIAASLDKPSDRKTAGTKAWQQVSAAAWGEVCFYRKGKESRLAFVIEGQKPNSLPKLQKYAFMVDLHSAANLRSVGIKKTQIDFFEGPQAFQEATKAELVQVSDESEIREMEHELAATEQTVRTAADQLLSTKSIVDSALAQLHTDLLAHPEIDEGTAHEVYLTASGKLDPLWTAVKRLQVVESLSALSSLQGWLKSDQGHTFKTGVLEAGGVDLSTIFSTPVAEFVAAVRDVKDTRVPDEAAS